MRVSNDLLILFINYDGSCFLTAPTKAQISDWAVLRYIHTYIHIYIYIYIYMKWKSQKNPQSVVMREPKI